MKLSTTLEMKRKIDNDKLQDNLKSHLSLPTDTIHSAPSSTAKPLKNFNRYFSFQLNCFHGVGKASSTSAETEFMLPPKVAKTWRKFFDRNTASMLLFCRFMCFSWFKEMMLGIGTKKDVLLFCFAAKLRKISHIICLTCAREQKRMKLNNEAGVCLKYLFGKIASEVASTCWHLGTHRLNDFYVPSPSDVLAINQVFVSAADKNNKFSRVFDFFFSVFLPFFFPRHKPMDKMLFSGKRSWREIEFVFCDGGFFFWDNISEEETLRGNLVLQCFSGVYARRLTLIYGFVQKSRETFSLWLCEW